MFCNILLKLNMANRRNCLVPRLVFLAGKVVGAQGRKGRGKDVRRLADFVFRMAQCLMADDYEIFKKEHRPVRLPILTMPFSCQNIIEETASDLLEGKKKCTAMMFAMYLLHAGGLLEYC